MPPQADALRRLPTLEALLLSRGEAGISTVSIEVRAPEEFRKPRRRIAGSSLSSPEEDSTSLASSVLSPDCREVGGDRLRCRGGDSVAAGHRVPRRREWPAGLTAREVEVLRLLARGLSNKEIARQLVISPMTAGNHIEHIYSKIDASTRATASLFAMQQGLLPDEQFAVDAHA